MPKENDESKLLTITILPPTVSEISGKVLTYTLLAAERIFDDKNMEYRMSYSIVGQPLSSGGKRLSLKKGVEYWFYEAWLLDGIVQ